MKRLKELRENKHLTQAQLSKFLNISASTIGMYEQGRRFPDEILLKNIAQFFNVSLDYLLGLTDIPYTVDDYIAKQKKADKQPVDNQYSTDERKIIDMYRQLSEKDKGKVEGRLEEMLDDEQATTKGA